MSSDSTDIAIVGGGLIGLCAALALQHPDRRITLIEASDIRADVSGGINARSIALSASSAQIFHALSLWPELELHAAPIRTIHVSAQGRWGVTRLQASDYRLDAMGYVVEHHQLMQCLLRSVDDNPNIILQTGAEFESIDEGSKSVVGYRQDGKLHQLTSTLTLIADGARSKARDALGIEHKTIDYGQSVLICNVEFSKPGNQVAYERFTNQGPLAMLPLGGKRYACVWTLDPDRSDLVCHYDDQDFSRALQACFGFRLGNIESVGARFSIPIQRTRALQLHQGRHLLIGNAANALHPVAGQGFNLALRDIACLYELLADQNI
ncbi:MAG: FAD-dependent monooxygenase [Pseudomonadota bacterium]